MFTAGIAGDDADYAVFLSVVGRPWSRSSSTKLACFSLVLLVTMHFALCSLRCRHVRGRALHRLCQWHVLGWVLWVTFHPRCVPCCRLQARDARHHGRFYTFSRGFSLGDDFRIVSVFSAELVQQQVHALRQSTRFVSVFCA